MIVTETDVEEVDEEAKLARLRMEHFYFPIGIWFVGIILSIIFLLAEIIIHRIRKSQIDEAPRLSDAEGAEVDFTVS